MICADCPSPVSRDAKRCKSCAAKRRFADPAAREAMSEAKKAALRDPVKRERVRSAAARNLREWRARPDSDPAGLQRHRRRVQLARNMDWCPRSKWPAYFTLTRVKRVPAPEAKALILEEVRHERAEGRRIVARIDAAMRTRREREQAQAY